MEDKLIALNRFFRERNMNAQDIAEKVGMSRVHINNLLSGKSKFIMKTACLFSDVFGFSPAWLMTGDGVMLGGAAGTTNEAIGKRLNEFIQQKNITKAEAARRVGVVPTTMHELTSGKRTISSNYAERISAALGVSTSWLFTGVEPMEVENWTPPAETPQNSFLLHRENSELRAEVERLRKQVERLMSVVENLTKGKEEA